MRRERNKMAAARCRKRRMDHTNALLLVSVCGYSHEIYILTEYCLRQDHENVLVLLSNESQSNFTQYVFQHNFFPPNASFAIFHYIIFQEHKIMHTHVFRIILSLANSERCS